MKYIFLLLFIGTVNAAEPQARKWHEGIPYWLFTDSSVIRVCSPPMFYGDPAICMTNGKKTECKPLTPDQGFIDCS